MIIPTMIFVPYQPFDLDISLKVKRDPKKFKIAILNKGTKTTLMTFCNLFPVDIV